jgi:hypothetical protein
MSGMEWQQTRPGSRRKVLHSDAETGKLTILVQWDAGYRMSVLERHRYDEHPYILSGTFIDERRSCRVGAVMCTLCRSRRVLDALLKGVARREFDIVAAWSACRLGRSPLDLIGPLGELPSRDDYLYLHQQALDTSTPSGRALFGMLGVFSEFERAMIRDRVLVGLDRARSSGKRLGRPRTTPFTVQRIRTALDEGRGVRETARLLNVSAPTVRRIAAEEVATAN